MGFLYRSMFLVATFLIEREKYMVLLIHSVIEESIVSFAGKHMVKRCVPSQSQPTKCSSCQVPFYTETYNTKQACEPCTRCTDGERMSVCVPMRTHTYVSVSSVYKCLGVTVND